MDEIRHSFRRFDRDGDGAISCNEAHQVLQEELGFSSNHTRRLVKVYDRNGDGTLSYEEYIWFYWKIKGKREELQKMFKKFDLDKDSHVTYEEARWVLHDFGFTDQQVMELMEIHDVNKDGRLQYQEFVHFWNNCGGNDSFTTYTTPKVTIVGASVIDSHDCDTADGTPLISKVQVTGLSTSSTKQIYSTQIPVCAPSLGLAATSNIISTSETLHEKLKTPVTVSETSADNVSPLMRSNVVLNLSRRHAECPNSFGKNGSTKLSRKMTVLQTSKRTATGKIELNTLTESAPASSEPNYVSQK